MTDRNNNQQTDQDRAYLTEKHLAKRWGISIDTLQRWRWRKVGPSYIKIGRHIRYSLKNIRDFEKETECISTSTSCVKNLLTIKNEARI
jgi:hypothetical protein